MTSTILSPVAYSYRVDDFVEAARERAGAPDYEFKHLDALERLLTSLNETGALNAAGVGSVRGALVAALATQAQADQARELHPEIAQVQINKPVFITGMTRTGTSFMHNLLGQHPKLRAPDLWELMAPATTRRDPETRLQLMHAAEAFTTNYYECAPKLLAVHYWHALRPDEDHRLTAPTFKSMAFELRYNVSSYGEWLKTQDQYDAYDYHKYLMQHILWRVPTETLVQKDPFHLWRPDALVRTYPDARLIYMHRRPGVTIPSTCSLTEIIRLSRSDQVDRPSLGKLWVTRFAEMLELMSRAEKTTLANTPIFNVNYERLMKAPIDVLGEICDFLGLPMDGAAEYAFRSYLEHNQQTRFGKHDYTAEDYGLNEAELDERFAAYRSEYGV